MTTMVDIARRAGVSLSTVSHALSGKRPISEETKQRIFEVMAELDYQPHALARGLATRRSKIVALLLPFQYKGLLEAQFIFVASAAEAASELDYSLVLWTSPSKDSEVLRMTQKGFIDGLILMEIKLNDPRVEMLKARQYPFSLIGHCAENAGTSFVDLDFDYTVRECVEYLAGLGHRRIGLITQSPSLFKVGYGPTVRSCQSFEQATRDLHLTGLIRLTEPTAEGGYAAMQSMLAEDAGLSAMINVTETTLRGSVQAIQDAGRCIPDDFSVIGFSVSRQDGLGGIALTTIDFPAAEMGRLGTQMLIRQLEDKSVPPEQVLLRPGLTIRESTGRYQK